MHPEETDLTRVPPRYYGEVSGTGLLNDATTLETYATDSVTRPVYTYLAGHLAESTRTPANKLLRMAARVFDVLGVKQKPLNESEVVSLYESFPQAKESSFGTVRVALLAELNGYNTLAAAADVSDANSAITFFNEHKTSLTAFHCLLRIVLAMPVSTAHVERVFSLLRATFGDRQESSLADYKRLSIMMQYNNSK